MTKSNTETTTSEELSDKYEFEAEIPTETLRLIGETLSPIVDGAELHFTETEVFAEAMGATAVHAVRTGHHEIEANQSATIGVNPTEIGPTLEEFSPNVETLTVYSDLDDVLVFAHEGWTTTLETAELQYIRETPDIDEILDGVVYQVKAELPAWEFLGALFKVANPANSVRLGVQHGELKTEGLSTEWDPFDVSGDEWEYVDYTPATFETEPDTNTTAPAWEYDDTYILEVTKLIPATGTVTVQFGGDVPLVVKSSEGPSVLVAPRLSREETEA